jgi:hypothetical protein
MIRTATVNVVTGEMTITNPATIDGILADATSTDPWGTEEHSTDRATEALADLGYARTSDWVQSDTPDSEWTCTVQVRAGRPSLDRAGTTRVTITMPRTVVVRLDGRAASVGVDRAELVRRYVAAGLGSEPTVTLAELTRHLGCPASDQQAVLAWTGEPVGKTWTEAEADELETAWLVDQLNQHGGDVWQDVILPSGLYDEDATAALDPRGASDVIALTGGTVIRWDAQRNQWYCSED